MDRVTRVSSRIQGMFWALGLVLVACQTASPQLPSSPSEADAAADSHAASKQASPERARELVDYPLIPLPARLIPRAGDFTWSDETQVQVAASDPATLAVGKRLTAVFGGHLVQQSRASSGAQPTVELRLDAAIEDPEGYELSVAPEELHLRAKTERGLFYGFQTLRQLARPLPDQRTLLPSVHIEDAPRFSYRGMHLDVGRHFFSVEAIKRYIDFLARYKFNTFHWHLTEDQGWRIEIEKYPRLTKVGAYRKETLVGHHRDQPHRFDGKRYGGYYTQREVREVVRYAAQRHIEVIPEIELPGHSLAALAAYPELACTPGPFEVATKWGIFEDVYCPKEETFEFLENVLSEVIALFPSRRVHIGGDEVPKTRWEDSVVAQAVMKREGLEDEEELQSYFIRRIAEFLESKGRRLVGWDEILEGGLAKDATVMSWRGTEGGVEAARQGHDVIMAPNEFVYFNTYQSDDFADEPIAASGFLPLEKVYAFDPVPDELDPEQAQHVLGAQGCVWTEYIATPQKLEYMVFPRMQALAEVVWSPEGARSFASFSQRLPHELAWLESLGVRYAKHFFRVQQTQRLQKGGILVRLSAPRGTIHYTLDGSSPTSGSPRYEGPLFLESPTTLRAVAVRNGVALSEPSTESYVVHAATGVRGQYAASYSPRYPSEGAKALTNGRRGSAMFGDGQWQGFNGVDLDVTFDLKQRKTVREVEIGFLRSIAEWIVPPKEVEVFLSEDGREFERIALLEPRPLKGPEPAATERLVAEVDPRHARYVRVRARNGGPLPSWHKGAQKPAWLFVDEVVVR